MLTNATITLTCADFHFLPPKVHYRSMRECYNILFMDNLVRLTTHEDPNPGDNRTSQLCTLPLTVKGLPLDSDLPKKWHEDGCLKELNCECLNRNTVSKDQIKQLTVLNETEKKMHDVLSVQSVWGLCNIWEKIINSAGQGFINMFRNTGVQNDGDLHKELDEINVSMRSVCLDDFDGDQEELHDEHPLHVSEERPKEEALAQLLNRQVDEDEEFFDCCIERDEVNKSSEDDGEDGDDDAGEDGDDDDGEDDKDDDDDEDDTNDVFDETDEENDFDESSNYEGLTTWPPSPIQSIDNEEELDAYEEPEETNNYEFNTFLVPALLCRHPKPATGRDDDKKKLADVLHDLLLKLGRVPPNIRNDRILFAPDYKIAKNLFALKKENFIFQTFLAEFPILHLKKSKIKNLTSAYKTAGLVHLLMYMKGEEKEKDISEVISLYNIESAARDIRRLAIAFHLAFIVRFLQTLDDTESSMLQDDMSTQDAGCLAKKWNQRYNQFLKEGSSKNATFALHQDIMTHIDEVVAISIAERIGGEDGYNLLLSVVKSSLPLSFLNGSSSYASFCVHLLHEHLTAGPFHRKMKCSLFSTPHKDSSVNFGLDLQREMDHKDAIKGFRPHSTLNSVIARMSVVDTFTSIKSTRESIKADESRHSLKQDSLLSTPDQEERKSTYLNAQITETDMLHALPTASLILKLNALDMSQNAVPYNVYEIPKRPLSPVMLKVN